MDGQAKEEEDQQYKFKAGVENYVEQTVPMSRLEKDELEDQLLREVGEGIFAENDYDYDDEKNEDFEEEDKSLMQGETTSWEDEDDIEAKKSLDDTLDQQYKKAIIDKKKNQDRKLEINAQPEAAWGEEDKQNVRQAWKESVYTISKETIDGNGFVILGKTMPELQEFVKREGQQKMRAKQMYQSVHVDGVRNILDISTIPLLWRKELHQRGVKTGRSQIYEKISSEDGTTKVLLKLDDGRIVEAVGIPNVEGTKSKLTVCISSQVGCPMRCSFCATGKGGFARNLMPHEIVDQVLTVQQEMGFDRTTNVVFMGMGEPLLNIPSVVRAYKTINQSLGIGGRSITISTVGIPNGIRRLGTYKLQCTLAVSLHAPNQYIREQIVPSAKSYPLDALMEDCVAYFHTTGRRMSFEYTLLYEVNDKPEHAVELAKLIKRHDIVAHINLIPWNPIEGADYHRPDGVRVKRFQKELIAAGVKQVSIRSTRGDEVNAACGQLRNNFVKQPLQNLNLQMQA